MAYKYIPYSTQEISDSDVTAVVTALTSGWLTGGRFVSDFEDAFSRYITSNYSTALSSGTAALHACMRAISLSPGDEVIVPSLSFIATANAVVYEQGIPVFCDVATDTLLIDTTKIQQHITPRTKAIIAVDYAGQLCDYQTLHEITDHYGLTLIADCCHSLGASQNTIKAGKLAHLSAFSFHPVKQLTTGEGGMVTTNSKDFYTVINKFRNHAIDHPPSERQQLAEHSYTICDLGWNYRITDIQAALGLNQLKRLDQWVAKRRQLANIYTAHFSEHPKITPLYTHSEEAHSYHLYVVTVPDRDIVFAKMREHNIGVNVHYIPIHMHEYYQKTFKASSGMCPVAENAYNHILSIPLYPSLSEDDQQYVIDSLIRIVDDL